jgi:Pretoxin HINT domain
MLWWFGHIGTGLGMRAIHGYQDWQKTKVAIGKAIIGDLSPVPDGCSPPDPWDDPVEFDLSFSANTLVLLASRKAIPISQLKVGDKVVATDTKTGRTQPEAIYAVLTHHDTDLYDLKISDHGKTAVIRTTSNHPFWVPGTHGHAGKWVTAGNLKSGTRLRTPSGSDTATVVSGRTPRQHDDWMWDLTIPGNNDHDFYVEAGTVSVLVHNGCGSSGDGSIDPRDVHGAFREATRDVNANEVWNNRNSEMYFQNDGQVVKVLSNGDGTYSAVIKDLSNPSGNSTTVIERITQGQLDRYIESRRWE